MRTFLRPSRLRGFGLVDTLMGLILLALTAALFFSGGSTLVTLDGRQARHTSELLGALDAQDYAPWL